VVEREWTGGLPHGLDRRRGNSVADVGSSGQGFRPETTWLGQRRRIDDSTAGGGETWEGGEAAWHCQGWWTWRCTRVKVIAARMACWHRHRWNLWSKAG
jgi:hypothetical protein